MKYIGLFCFLILTFASAGAQEINRSYHSGDTIMQREAGTLWFSVHNNNFLKNNEYFNPFQEGITYFGSQIQPELSYSLTQNTTLTAGWFFRYFYGTAKFNTSIPVFRFEYNPIPGIGIVFGQLHGLLGHRLLEPIYCSDNYFTRNPEYGIQLLLQKGRINSDVWISWDHFILPGDNSKEEITGGTNSSVLLLGTPGQNALSAHLQAVVHHFGGQVDESGQPLETRLNLAPGIEYEGSFHPDQQWKYLLGAYLVQAADRSSIGTIPYTKGFASYTYGKLQYRWASLLLSYFHGEYYFSPLGEPLYQSISQLNDWYYEDTRNLLNAKLLLDKEIGKGIYLGFRFESYYDTGLENLSFNYGMNIKVDADWKILQKKSRH